MSAPPTNLAIWLLAFSPIAVVLVLMVGLRWGARRAGPVGWVVAVAVAYLRFGSGFEVLLTSQGRGLLLSLYVLYIIWMALVLYRVVDEAGAITVIGQGIARLTADPTMQLLLLAFGFASFLQGITGFGVPIAVVAPLLIGLEFDAVVAVSAVSIGHSWAVTFGSIASSFQALIAASGLSGHELAPWSATLLGISCFGCGIGTAWMLDGWHSVRQGWLPLLVMSGIMAVVQAGLAIVGLWTLAAFGAGMAGLAVGAIVAQLPRYQVAPEQRTEEAGSVATSRSPMPLVQAVSPYLLLVIVVTAAELWPWLNKVLNQVQLRIAFPEVQTSYGWTTPAGVGRTISVFGHPGALLAYVSVITYLFYHFRGYYGRGVIRRIVQSTVRSAVPSTIGIATMVGMAAAMELSGMTYVLAQGLSRVAGPVYPFVSPFIGLLGAFMTGSNTNSNVVFAPLQQRAAAILQLSPLLILAAQTAGGSLGSMLAPAKLVVGCSTTGLAGQEGRVLSKILVPALLMIAVIGLVVSALILTGVL